MKLPKNLGFSALDATPLDPAPAESTEVSANNAKKNTPRPNQGSKAAPSSGFKPLQRKAQGRRSA